MIEYPKIETLYTRDDRFKVTTELRLPEFGLVTEWWVTEKIDGMNVRVILDEAGRVRYAGRTDDAMLPAKLVDYLRAAVPDAKVAAAFDPETQAVIFGEAYGAGIQSGGKYRADLAVRVFDVAVLDPRVRVTRTLVGSTPADVRVVTTPWAWWLRWGNICDVATKVGLAVVPSWGRLMSLEDAIAIVRYPSQVASIERGHTIGPAPDHEGIVARTEPALFTRRGDRLIWKLKAKDLTSKAAARRD